MLITGLNYRKFSFQDKQNIHKSIQKRKTGLNFSNTTRRLEKTHINAKNVNPASHLMGAGVKGISPAVMWPGCKANISLPSGLKVENDWIYTSAHPDTFMVETGT
jgi:hypothetical protein